MPVSKKKARVVAATLIHGIKPYVEKKGEEYMGKKMLDHFRAILNAGKQELLEEVSRTVHTMQDETANHPDPNDRASQETDMSLELRSRDRERKLIKKIEEATAKIDSNDYGSRETCGVEMRAQRLA